MQTANYRKALSSFVRICISIILLFILFKSKNINLKELAVDIRHANKAFLLLSFGAFFLTYIISLLRWAMLLRAANLHISLKRAIISFSGGIFFSLILPSTIGGDFTRSIDLSLHTKRPRQVVATVLLDRLSGYAGLVFLVLVSLFFGWSYVRDNKFILFSITIISFLLVLILLVLFNNFFYTKINNILHSPKAGKIRQAIIDLHREMHIFRQHKMVLAKNFLLSIAIQAIGPLTLYLTCLSLGQKINFIYFLIFTPIIGAITLLPISIGGLGVRENLTVYLFGYAGLSKGTAVGMAIISFSFILLCGIIGGIIYVLTVHHRRIQHYKPPSFQPHE